MSLKKLVIKYIVKNDIDYSYLDKNNKPQLDYNLIKEIDKYKRIDDLVQPYSFPNETFLGKYVFCFALEEQTIIHCNK